MEAKLAVKHGLFKVVELTGTYLQRVTEVFTHKVAPSHGQLCSGHHTDISHIPIGKM